MFSSLDKNVLSDRRRKIDSSTDILPSIFGSGRLMVLAAKAEPQQKSANNIKTVSFLNMEEIISYLGIGELGEWGLGIGILGN